MYYVHSLQHQRFITIVITKTCIDNLSTKLETYGTQYVSTTFLIATSAITFGSLSRRIRDKIKKESRGVQSEFMEERKRQNIFDGLF